MKGRKEGGREHRRGKRREGKGREKMGREGKGESMHNNLTIICLNKYLDNGERERVITNTSVSLYKHTHNNDAHASFPRYTIPSPSFLPSFLPSFHLSALQQLSNYRILFHSSVSLINSCTVHLFMFFHLNRLGIL